MTGRDPFQEGAPAARARRRRSLAIALALVAFVAIVFSTTIIRIGKNSAGVRDTVTAGAAAPAPARSGSDG